MTNDERQTHLCPVMTDDEQTNLYRVRPPWMCADHKSLENDKDDDMETLSLLRTQNREITQRQWPLLPPQDCLIMDIRLKSIVHAIAERHHITEIDKTIYPVLQFAAYQYILRCVAEMSAAARRKQTTISNAISTLAPSRLRAFPRSNPDAYITDWARSVSIRQQQQEKQRMIEKEQEEEKEREEGDGEEKEEESEVQEEEEEEEEDGAEEQSGDKDDAVEKDRKKRVRNREKKRKAKELSRSKNSRKKRREFNPIVEEKRANAVVGKIMQSTTAMQQQQETVHLSPEQVSAAIDAIDRNIVALQQRLKSVAWDYRSAVKLRELSQSLETDAISESELEALQQLKWRVEAHEKIGEAIRKLTAQRKTLVNGGPTRGIEDAAQAQMQRQVARLESLRMDESSQVPVNSSLETRFEMDSSAIRSQKKVVITMQDALACERARDVFQRYETRRCQKITVWKRKEDEEREQARAILAQSGLTFSSSSSSSSFPCHSSSTGISRAQRYAAMSEFVVQIAPQSEAKTRVDQAETRKQRVQKTFFPSRI